ncbi:nucleotide-diphospho-sugar transferase [Methanococcus sp. CF]
MNNEKFVPEKPLNTPVLFLIFNRLDTTKQVFEIIREAKPPRLYLASDGPRENRMGEDETVNAVRGYVLDSIDWDCEVKTLFRDKNLGCKYAVSGAITWFFENEEMGIILEDDCLPSQSFFWFCEELLNWYKDDLRIWQISGDNFQNGIQRGTGDYYFSRYIHIWGWATWRSRWNCYDVDMKNFETFSNNFEIKNVFNHTKTQRHWIKLFKEAYLGNVDTWDYQWFYCALSNNGLGVMPNKNLVTNIGFGLDATHTKNEDSKNANINRHEISLPLIHPEFITPNCNADEYTFKYILQNGLLDGIVYKLRYLVGK